MGKMKKLSVAMITLNEAANLPRTLESVAWADEINIVDNGSTDGTQEIAAKYGARVFTEPWKGFGAQMNSALAKCTAHWILSLDADEVVTPELAEEVRALLAGTPEFPVYSVPRKNMIFGRWLRHGGLYPDRKLRLFQKGTAYWPEDIEPHSTGKWNGPTGALQAPLLHHQYPSLTLYIEHMNRYSTASVPTLLKKGKTSRGLSAFVWNVVLTPLATFAYNYIFRLGFLDGREGLLLHLTHSGYVHWKYAKTWQAGRK
jgi:glycosyltransferase involved in cell wall biosynthesis